MRGFLSKLALGGVLIGVALVPSAAQAHGGDPLPEVIQLPLGFQPEGVARGRRTTLYVASINTGGVYKADARTGTGALLVPPRAGGSAVGIKFDGRTNLLFVAGGSSGHAFVYDARTGTQVADVALSAGGSSFINDLVITRRAVFFTDSFKPVFYKLPLRRDGRLPSEPSAREIPLGGDYKFVPDQFNANGIERTADGDDLLIVNGHVGELYRVDPRSGVADVVDLGDGNVINGDGLVLRERLLYVVQNFSNTVSVVKLSRRADRGRIIETITSPLFDIPATAAFLKGALYVTNARFTTPVTPTTPYTLVRIPVDE